MNALTVGALPDMVTFTPNGQLVLLASSVSIIDMRRGVLNLTEADVTTAGFSAFNDATLDSSIRIHGPNSTVAEDLEPEYIAVSHDSQTAWVTLQENNALAILDLNEKRVTTGRRASSRSRW